ENSEIEVHRLIDDVRRAVHGLAEVQLADRNEALDVVADIDDDALVHQSDDLSAQLGSDRISLTDAKPWILGSLLETEGNALVLGIDVENDDIDRVAFLHDFRRMLDPLGPRHVGDVDQAIDSRLDFDKRTKAGEVANLAVETSADRILLRQHHPRILLRLLHTERDLLFVRIDLEHHGFDRLADGNELRRVTNVARPAHLADVYESFDARLELD